MTTATTRPTGAPTTHTDPGFAAAFRSEWDKLRTARAPRRNLLLGTVLGIAMSLLLSLAVATTFDQWNDVDRADFDPLLYPMSGSLLLLVFYVAAVVGLVVPEYTSGMIRLTLTATPRRGRILLAKALVAAVATGIANLIAFAGMIGGSQVIFAANDLPTVELGSWDLWRAVVMLVVTGPLVPVLGVATAFLLRSATATMALTLALVLAPSMFGGLLPGWWERNVMSLLPGPAADSLSIAHLADSPQHLHPVPAVLVVIAWVVGMLLLARGALERRDA